MSVCLQSPGVADSIVAPLGTGPPLEARIAMRVCTAYESLWTYISGWPPNATQVWWLGKKGSPLSA